MACNQAKKLGDIVRSHAQAARDKDASMTGFASCSRDLSRFTLLASQERNHQAQQNTCLTNPS